MSDDAGVSLETTMRALLLIALRGIDTDTQVDTLTRAGFGNTEIAKMTGMTANAVGLRKSRGKKRVQK